MDFSFSTLAAGFIFGTLGMYVIKRGKDCADLLWIGLGIVMICYSFFVTNPYLCWGIGFVLLGVVFATR